MSVAFAIGVIVLGAIAAWLMALIPALTMTLLKGQWRLFSLGFLTAGFSWFMGAFSFAPPGSRWAQRFYDPEQRARAELPVRDQRSPATRLIWAGSAISLVAVLGFFALRPAPLLGISGRTLENSMGGGSFLGLGFPLPPCEQLSHETWACSAWDSGQSGAIPYRVKVHNLGCWTAMRAGSGRDDSAKHRSGCVTIFDLFE